MKSLGWLLILAVCALVVQDSSAWLWGRRRISRPAPPPRQPCQCTIICQNSQCHVGGCCINTRGRKRTYLTGLSDTANTDGLKVGFPKDFSLYDENKDNFITLAEFKDAILSHMDNLDDPDYLDVVFVDADANGDEKLDEDEFITAPWAFADEGDLEKITDRIADLD